jgi:hypothetical protein
VVSLEGARLLLPPPPGLSTERREALLAALERTTELVSIPMLELVAFPERASSDCKSSRRRGKGTVPDLLEAFFG